ncbi:MAG: epoxyqueuosine reductase [Clostridia bacterium]|nr:epoxyqueuosine reductase [Clostridia bacterium]
MNKEIEKIIVEYVAAYPKIKGTQTTWKTPIIGIARADHSKFDQLKSSVQETHLTPKELLSSGESVIAFFLPFQEEIALSNKDGLRPSRAWAVAYIETNTLIGELSQHLIAYLKGRGYEGETVSATHNFDEATLMSDWSHRHVAEITGIGKFGLNNMLITDSGCAGRVGSVVTSMCLESTAVDDRPTCLYHMNGTCGLCVDRCPQSAFEGGFNRFKCYELLLDNDAYYDDLGLVDVCGKCCVALPCTFGNPCKNK